MQAPGWGEPHRQQWIHIRDHPLVAVAAAAVTNGIEAEKFPPFPWRNITNNHTTNRSHAMGGGTMSLARSMTVVYENGGHIGIISQEHSIYHNDNVPLVVRGSWPLAAVKDAQAQVIKNYLGHLLVMAVERISMPPKAFQRGMAAIQDIYAYAAQWHNFLLGQGPQPGAYQSSAQQPQPPQPQPQPAQQPQMPQPQPAFGGMTQPAPQPPPPQWPPPQPAR